MAEGSEPEFQEKTSIQSRTTSVFCFGKISNSWFEPKAEPAKNQAVKMSQQLRIPIAKTKLPIVGDVRSLTLKQLICGIVAGGLSSAIASPLGTIRTKLIAGRGGKSAAEVVHTIQKTSGLQSLMPGGILLSIFLASLKQGVQFMTYEAVKRTEEQRIGRDPSILPLPRSVQISTVAGALSGLASLLVTYPLSTVSDRITLQPKEYSSLFGALHKVFTEEGFKALYYGLGPAVTKILPSAAVEFYTYDLLRNKFMEQSSNNIGVIQSLLIGGAASVMSTSLTYPLEIARKQISLSALPKGSVGIGGSINYSGTLEAIRGVIHREGVGGLYRGLNLELLQIVPTTALSFMVYEIMKRAIVAVGEERRDEVKDL